MPDPCQHVQHLLRTEAPLDATAAAHLEECEECMRVELDLLAGPEDEVDLAEVRAAVRADRARGGVRARLVGLSTPVRHLLGVGFTLVLALAFGLGALRPDIASVPQTALMAAVGVHVLLIGWTILYALRTPTEGLTRPASPGLRAGLALLCLGCVAAFPWTAESATVPDLGTLLTTSVDCFVKGGLLALLPLVALRVLDREDAAWLGDGKVLAAVAAGTAGNLGLLLACPAPWSAHMLLGHVGILAVYVAIAVVWVEVGSRRAMR